MSELTCPYCSKEVEPGEGREQDVTYEKECPHCEKNFVYTVEYWPSYSESQAPCLNGGEHNFEKIHGYPEWYFKNKFRCSHCAEERFINNG